MHNGQVMLGSKSSIRLESTLFWRLPYIFACSILPASIFLYREVLSRINSIIRLLPFLDSDHASHSPLRSALGANQGALGGKILLNRARTLNRNPAGNGLILNRKAP